MGGISRSRASARAAWGAMLCLFNTGSRPQGELVARKVAGCWPARFRSRFQPEIHACTEIEPIEPLFFYYSTYTRPATEALLLLRISLS